MLYVFAHFSDKLRMRSPFILAGLVMCLIGFSINISSVANGVKYFGTFFVVAGVYAPFPGVVAWSVTPTTPVISLDQLISLISLGSGAIFLVSISEGLAWPYISG